MPTVTLDELEDSREQQLGGARPWTLYHAVARSTDDEDQEAVAAYVLANRPATLDDLPPQAPVIKKFGYKAWEVKIRYAEETAQSQQTPTPPPAVGDRTYSFNTTGGTQHVTQSLATVGGYTLPGALTQPDFGRAINVTDDGVDGVDISVRQHVREMTIVVSDATMDAGLEDTLFELTACVNSGTFQGRAAGEVLFLGAAATKRVGDAFWTVTLYFALSRNKTGLEVGDITGISKGGWEVLWAAYEHVEDTAAKRLIRKPYSAYVERVYESASFAALAAL